MIVQELVMNTFIDQTGYKIKLNGAPQRIVSVVPSQSELLWDLGLKDQLVGISKFCIHPKEMFANVQKVGGTKKLDLDKIRRLKPDLIIGNKEENEKGQIELLRKEFPVWMSDIYNLNNAYNMIEKVGEITGKEANAASLIKNIKERFSQLHLSSLNGKKVAYFIWYDPLMAVGSNTFIDSIITELRMRNVFNDLKRYPEISKGDLQRSGADFIFLSSEPFPFKQKHIDLFEKSCPNAKVVLVDGEMFSWYGSRLLKAPAYFEKLNSDLDR